jgi:hypothetical protein
MRRALAILGLSLLLAAPAAAAGDDEVLVYRWHLDGFLGALAGLFLPNSGEGLLTRERLADGHLKSELRITASEQAGGDYFLYGAEWAPATETTVRAWSGQRWRGEEKSKSSEVGQAGVVDVATAVYVLRRDPPTVPRQLEIWSDGKLYPVIVLPHGVESRHVGDRDLAVRHFSVRGYRAPGRRLWKGQLDLWLADDEAATPVEILVARSAARVRLELIESRPAGQAGAEAGATVKK